jgi:hypothetical protein
MAGFIYFLEGIEHDELVEDGSLNEGILRSFRLHDVFADVRDVPEDCIVTPVTSGPSESAGCVLFPISTGAEIPRLPGYFPESQTWLAPGSQSGCWLGFVAAEPPRPEDIERSPRIGGYWVPDGNGRTWCIPVIRGQDKPHGTLPDDYQWTDEEDLEPTPVLRKEYEQLWNDSARIWDHVYKDNHREDTAFVAKFVARCLQLNFRIGPRELNAFRELGTPIFDVKSLDLFAAMAVDYLAVKEFTDAKKR